MSPKSIVGKIYLKTQIVYYYDIEVLSFLLKANCLYFFPYFDLVRPHQKVQQMSFYQLLANNIKQIPQFQIQTAKS